MECTRLQSAGANRKPSSRSPSQSKYVPAYSFRQTRGPWASTGLGHHPVSTRSGTIGLSPSLCPKNARAQCERNDADWKERHIERHDGKPCYGDGADETAGEALDHPESDQENTDDKE